MRALLTFLLYVFIIALIGGIVFGITYLLEKPIEVFAIIYGLVLATWLLIVLIKKLIIYYRARSQALKVLKQEHAERDADLGMSPKQLNKNLLKSWKTAVKLLKKSHLRLKGDPLYVLPWYMVFGKPRSGKSTSLKNAKLLSPAMELSNHDDGSTLNLEWWLYDQAIVIDTAGRYAVPDVDKRDRKEWTSLLSMLSRHKQKEPLNGLVLVVAADRLLNNTEEELLEEGLQVRTGINDLMEQLEIRMPVYLMVTKCDLVDQFTNWCQYLPEQSLDQVMGYLCDEEVSDIDATLDQAFDEVLNRLKELRLLMMERGDYPDDSLIELPNNLEKLRKGLHYFAQTALKNNLYQETPKFRGLYFSSSQQESIEHTEKNVVNKGHFLHHLFTKVMPPDRGLLSTLPSAQRIRKAIVQYGFSISSGVLLAFIVLLSSAYVSDRDALQSLYSSRTEINLSNLSVNDQLKQLFRYSDLINRLESVEEEWSLPWYGFAESSPHQAKLKHDFIETFDEEFLAAIDESRIDLSSLKSIERAYLVSGLVRRLNLVRTLVAEDVEGFDKTLEIPSEYLQILRLGIDGESAQSFNDLYREYLQLQNASLKLEEEQLKLQALLQNVLTDRTGNFNWLVDYANLQGFPKVKVSDFWRGSRLLEKQPEVEAAYTLEGRDFILKFLDELTVAGSNSVELNAIREEFMVFYERNYLKQWINFAENFEIGKQKLRTRKEWLSTVESFSSSSNPYFAALRKIQSEIEPVYSDSLFQSRELYDYFAEIQELSGDVAPAKSNKKAQKAALKVLGKLGKAGKLASKVAKKGLKAKKKLGGKGGEVSDEKLEAAAKVYQSYKASLKDLSFNAESSNLAYQETAFYFDNPKNLSAGDGAASLGWKSIIDLQKILGKQRDSNKEFWALYQGPVNFTQEFMLQETSCHVQQVWEDEILTELEGVTEENLGKTLIGSEGLIWKFTDETAAPFLEQKRRKGYVASKANKKQMDWDKDFMKYLNRALNGKNIVEGTFDVKISALPTGINQSSKISPYATFIDLHCANGVQTLANYNYSATQTFKWSLAECGDVSLRIEVGEFSLRKTYEGRKGFPQFLKDFRDGRKIFSVNNFPEFKSALSAQKVSAIDVNFEFSGQKPVVRIVNSVDLNPPSKALSCWADGNKS